MSDVPGLLKKAREHTEAGRVPLAMGILTKLVAKHPGNPMVHSGMCAALVAQGRFEDAVESARRAVKAAPNDPNMLANLAGLLAKVEQFEEVVPLYEKVLALDPARRKIREMFIALLFKEHRPWEAAEAARVGLERVPNDFEFMFLRAVGLHDIGRGEEAMALLRQCRVLNPKIHKLVSSMSNMSNYLESMAPEEIAALHREIEPLIPVTTSAPAPRPLAGRKMRVGLYSCDLRGHSVAYFIEPLLQEYDRTKFEFVCFSGAEKEDEVSDRLIALAHEWHRIASLTDEQLVETIRKARIDVLIDLTGISKGGRLGVFKAKPAPVQMAYCGYPNTTGLTTVDYRIVDARTDLPEHEARFPEKLLRLDPCFLCFKPIKGAPEVAPPPSSLSPSAPITFGSFNSLFKYSPRTVALWARIANAVPGSRVVIKSRPISDPHVQADVRGRFVAAGLDNSRLECPPWVPKGGEPLRAYDMIDIALDPFPYNGTTTTCEALMMGVPVVALEGKAHAGRVGLSLLSTVGRGEFVAKTEDEYFKIAVGLASDRARLVELRPRLRAELFASPLCDEKGFARKFEAGLMKAWHEKTGL